MVNKLNRIQKSSKACGSLLKSFLNNKNISIILQILHNNAFVNDFQKKAELFSSYFSNQCTLIIRNSTHSVNVHFLTDKRLSSFDFSENNIMKFLHKLNPNKTHGQDNISIRMIKILFQSLKKEINKFMKSIGPFRFCQFFEKFLKDLFLSKCFRFLSRTN